MLKIMLVDDEINVVEGLKLSIDWRKYGYQVIGEAYNGREAFEKVLELRPDVLITDITMPVMDGFELFEKLREHLPDIKVIFLTCHEDFNFARKAVKLNAFEYLIKETMTKEELYAVLEKITEVLETERSHKDKELNMTSELNKNRYHVGETIINDLLKGDTKNIDEIENRLNLYGYRFKYEKFIFSLLEVDQYEELTNTSGYKDRSMIKFVILNIVEEILDKYDIGRIFPRSDRLFVIVYNYQPNLKVSSFERIKQVSAEIQRAFWKTFESTCTLYIGDRRDSIKEAMNAFEEFEALRRARFYMKDEAIVTSEQKVEETEVSAEYLKECTARFEEALESFDREDSANTIKGLVDKACELRMDIFQVKYIAERFAAITGGFVAKFCNGSDTKALHMCLEEISNANSIFMIMDILMRYTALAFAMIEKNSATQSNTGIAKALQYINRHYQENITLESIAGYACMNSSYFSRLLKNKTGENFVDYLAKIRIEKAKELLIKSDLVLDEIAERVGHVNTAYFMKVFKKLTGITPGEYRKLKYKK